MTNKNIKRICIKENPYIRSAYIVFSEYYNFTKTAPYSMDVRKSLEDLIKILYGHLKYPKLRNYEIINETFIRKTLYRKEQL